MKTHFLNHKSFLILFFVLLIGRVSAQSLPQPTKEELKTDKILYKHRRTVAFS